MPLFVDGKIKFFIGDMKTKKQIEREEKFDTVLQGAINRIGSESGSEAGSSYVPYDDDDDDEFEGFDDDDGANTDDYLDVVLDALQILGKDSNKKRKLRGSLSN